jgi:predicted O-methyltransferase YrrM
MFYNFVLCYFLDRARRVEFTNTVLSFDQRKRLVARFPTQELTEIFPDMSSLNVSLEDFRFKPGNVSFDELVVIATLTRHLKPKIVFEFGTFDGNTTLQMARNSPSDCVIYTLDLPEGQHRAMLRLDPGDTLMMGNSMVRFQGREEARKIRVLRSDSATYDYSSLRKKVDLVFIDGAHSYEYVANDTEKGLEMLARGGVIVWHDYMVWNDVTDYLNERSGRLSLKHIRGTSLVMLENTK